MHTTSRTVAIPVLLLTLLLLVAPSAARAQGVSVAAYAWPTSVAQGDTVGIYVSCSEPAYDLKIYRDGKDYDLYASWSDLPGVLQPVPDSAFAKGCGWDASVMVPIPQSWPSGVYIAEVLLPDTLQYAIFVVRENHPGSTARILFQTSLTTWAAYNAWGGKSLYDHNSTEGHRSAFVSLERPFDDYQGRGFWPRWERKLARFLERKHFDVAYCTSADAHFLPQLENRYDLYVIVGHDEYWSYEMRNNIEGRIARGQSVAIFSGNTSWWQIRFDTPDVITCYKVKELDPLWGVSDHLVTVNWHDEPVYRPENYMTGVSFRNGGYHNFADFYPESLGYGGYTVANADHWVFEGTGLQNGDEFGTAHTIVGYETDGALYRTTGGLLEATGLDGSPLNYTILATAPASDGVGTMGIYEGPGTVFNAATTDWSEALTQDPPGDPLVERVTETVIGVLLSRSLDVRERSMPRASVPLAVGVEPNPTRSGALIRWSGGADAGTRVSIYDVRGALVARPPVEAPFTIGAVTWDGRDSAGRPVAAGLYFAVVETRGTRGAGKVLVVR